MSRVVSKSFELCPTGSPGLAEKKGHGNPYGKACPEKMPLPCLLPICYYSPAWHLMSEEDYDQSPTENVWRITGVSAQVAEGDSQMAELGRSLL